jgi:hypothetical protein
MLAREEIVRFAVTPPSAPRDPSAYQEPPLDPPSQSWIRP